MTLRRKVRSQSESVFEQLGFSPAEARALEIKNELLSTIVRFAKEHYSQADLQKILDEPQPRVSDLLRGKISKFSLETLVSYADALHMRPEIKTHKPLAAMEARATA
jgi:predicted XRE-type DNA-binding protein